MVSVLILEQMLLWNYDEVKQGWAFLTYANLRKLAKPSFWVFWKGGKSKEQRKLEAIENPAIDPHYKLLMANNYDEVPNWWYCAVLLLSFVVGLGTIYGIQSTLPWWGYIISNIFAAIFILFFGAQYAITGFQFNQQPILQMLAGYLHPGKPLGMRSTAVLVLGQLHLLIFFSKHVLHGFWLQWCSARSMARSGSQASSICSFIAKVHIHGPDARLCHWRNLQVSLRPTVYQKQTADTA